jgi:16S rRNA (guanine(966)-N(2))-methyltransferase RsmD
MRVQLRIVAGSLRGRKLTCDVHPGLRPTPQMVREALFSILGDAVPDRPFCDLFAGTGVIGLEALSRGASEAVFVERDLTLASAIERHLTAFGFADQSTIVRADVYRWAERWQPPAEPVNVFISPPFADYVQRLDLLQLLLSALERKIAPGSVLVLQGETSEEFDSLLATHPWEVRRYSRNLLAIWVKEESKVQSPKSNVEDSGSDPPRAD